MKLLAMLVLCVSCQSPGSDSGPDGGCEPVEPPFDGTYTLDFYCVDGCHGDAPFDGIDSITFDGVSVTYSDGTDGVVNVAGYCFDGAILGSAYSICAEQSHEYRCRAGGSIQHDGASWAIHMER